MADSAKMGVNRRNLERSVRPCMAEGRAVAAWDAIQATCRPGTDGGHSPPYTGDAYAVKQSHGFAHGPPVVLSSVETQRCCVSFARDRDDSLDDGTGPAIRPNKANRSRRVHSSRV